jgi:hypothetical protein
MSSKEKKKNLLCEKHDQNGRRTKENENKPNKIDFYDNLLDHL